MSGFIGSGATAKESWEVLRTLSIISNHEPSGTNLITGLEAGFPTEEEKATCLKQGELLCSSQEVQLKNPDGRVALQSAAHGTTFLYYFANGLQGIATGDYPQYGRCFWEMPQIGFDWVFQQSTVSETVEFGGRKHILWWEDGKRGSCKEPRCTCAGP